MPELFLATSVQKVDRKGRVSIPSRFRTAIAGSDFHGVVLFPPIGQPDASFYSGCSVERLLTYAEAGDEFSPLSQNSRDLGIALFSSAEQLPFDSEGRVVLPPQVMDQCEIKGEACFVGLGKTFEVWSADRFAAEAARGREAASRLLSEMEANWKSLRDRGPR